MRKSSFSLNMLAFDLDFIDSYDIDEQRQIPEVVIAIFSLSNRRSTLEKMNSAGKMSLTIIRFQSFEGS